MNLDENPNPDNMDFGDFSEYDESQKVEEDVYPDEEPNGGNQGDPYSDFETFDTYEEIDDDQGGGLLSGFSLPSFSGLNLGGEENRSIVMVFGTVILLLLCCWASSIPLILWAWNTF